MSDLSRPAIGGVLAETLILFGGLLISTGLTLHTLNFRVKELHSVITRRPRPPYGGVGVRKAHQVASPSSTNR